eukprot:TRINITY_DN23215_c0_g2_i1.p1 TRINITY_DN23215_c0_g2~~TRINITY_DN23215_c0_g2_i1.p1  ORF type:complete len:168 (+),score=62.72 TRINITY_DN23215_c0_g2_i1:90-593(+)
MCDSLVRVSIRGRQFQAQSAVLCKAHYFARLLREEQPAEDGWYHIDRDPGVFGMLLVYLRRGRLACNISEMPANEKLTLLSDILFYGIESLYELIERDREMLEQQRTQRAHMLCTAHALNAGEKPPQRKAPPQGWSEDDIVGPARDSGSLTMAQAGKGSWETGIFTD